MGAYNQIRQILSSGFERAKSLKKRSMRQKGGNGKVEKNGQGNELRSHPARLRFWEMDPRDKPEDDRATTIATTS